MKKKVSYLAATVIAALSLSSCCTINSNASLASDGPIGSKVGEATSNVILGFIGGGGDKATIKDAAQNGGIKNVKQVEYKDKSIFFGIVVKHTTRVYGD